MRGKIPPNPALGTLKLIARKVYVKCATLCFKVVLEGYLKVPSYINCLSTWQKKRLPSPIILTVSVIDYNFKPLKMQENDIMFDHSVTALSRW